MRQMNEKIVCADGFTMSVQAHGSGYCSPRVDDAPKYTAVEVGFPNQIEVLLMSFAEDETNPTDTVYGYVPVQVVTNVLAKHGGIVSGGLPPGIPYLRAPE